MKNQPRGGELVSKRVQGLAADSDRLVELVARRFTELQSKCEVIGS